MDTLSRDSSSSSNIAPIASLLVGALALILGIFALVKANKVQKLAESHDAEILKISTLESDVRSASTKSENDLRSLREGVQKALTDIGTEFGNVNARVGKVEEQMKKPAPAPAAGGAKAGGGAAASAGGTMNPDGTYTIASGDTLSKVAKKFGVSLDALLAENPGVEPRSLRVGQKVKIPGH